MARFGFRRSLRFEGLESRRLLSNMAGPTDQEQYMLQLLNEARTNPAEAATMIGSNITPDVAATLQYYNVNLQSTLQQLSSATPQPPLAWNADLAAAAQGHSQDMANTQVQSHTGSDGSSPGERIWNAGYTNASSSTENAFAYATSPFEAMQAFLIDWGVPNHGHRDNIMQPGVPAQNAYRDVGIGLVTTNSPNFGPLVVTQDFASKPNEQAQLVGVAYYDNGSHFYSIGSGQGGVQIDAVNLQTGAVSSTQTWSSGGYELPLAPGAYQVIASVNGTVVSSNQINVGTVNIEHDVILSNPWQGGSVAAAIAAAQPQAAVPTPAPTPSPVVAQPMVIQLNPQPAPAPAPAAAAQPVVQVVSQPVVNPQPASSGWQFFNPPAADSQPVPAPTNPANPTPSSTTDIASVDAALASWSTWNAQVN